MRPKNLASTAASAGPSSFAGDVTGDWWGTLNCGSMRLRLLVHFTRDSGGALNATLDSLDQGASGIPIDSVVLSDKRLAFRSTAIGMSFEGVVDSEFQVIDGTIRQGVSMPLQFSRANDGDLVSPRRPQTPLHTLTVKCMSSTKMSGRHPLRTTLTLPNGTGPFPAAVLIAGSGQHDRDATMFGHRPFLVLADV